MRILLAALLFFAPAAAFARCAGADLNDALRADDPAGYAAAESAAGEMANSEGVLWRVTAPGAPPSHLFGTFHALELADAPRGGEAAALARAARIVLVELTGDELAEMQRVLPTSTAMFINEAPAPLSDWLPSSQLDRAEAVLAEYGMTPAMAAMIQPWFLQVIIATPPCQALAFQTGMIPMDSGLEATAAAAKGLETWEEQIAAFRQGTLEEQRMALRFAFASPHSAEDMQATQRALYEVEKVALIWELSLMLAKQELPEAIIDELADEAWRILIADRNLRMADKAEDELRAGGALVAVGALHLPGADGLVEILRARGLIVERINN